jgi:predicted outer membrane repeat protein
MISGNTATQNGGGISSSGNATITNSTLNNHAAARGGAIH